MLKTPSGVVHFRSKFEAQVASDLIKKKVQFSYETVSYDYVISSSYTPDIILPNCVVELKGTLLKEERKNILQSRRNIPH